ncbi:MAG: aminomethyl-transferring glycine dehydrogenase subunit GcvPB [Chloroflexi bacterium]|nr:aminomethyl-transferring glycine dehydrogenase subunit GcvPB [Chloroflexota bacterium]
MNEQPRSFHAARWSEPLIMEMSSPGERGVLLPVVEPEIKTAVGDVTAAIPPELRRQAPPRLPEVSQPQVLRHYLRLSQETLGTDLNIDIGHGTCTEKYSPKINEQLVRLPQVSALHPLQDEETVQGMLEILYGFEQMLKEISGMDRFTFQPGGGSQGIYTNASIIRAYHAARGEADKRTEIITTIFSHPANAACPATAGFKVITLYPGRNGYPEPDALIAALSERTAGLMMTAPEDTGIYNPHVADFVRLVHEAGGLCAHDQANANGVLGIVRSRDLGFDLCQFNIHKTFSSPHGSRGPGAGAVGVTRELERFLPVPVVGFDGRQYRLDYDRPDSIGKVRGFYGVPPVILRAYAWVMSLGAAGLKEVAEIAVLNNLYLWQKLSEVAGVSIPWPEAGRRLAEVRCTWERLKEETGLGTQDLQRRMIDFGVASYFAGHHPWLVPEPCQLEPTETYSKADIDEFVGILRHVADEARTRPNVVRTAPHNSTIHEIDHAPFDDPARWAITWRAYLRKTRASVGSSTGSEVGARRNS